MKKTIIKGKHKGEDVLIKRLQFPVRLAFAMTINKSQRQSLEVCGINLEFPGFAHVLRVFARRETIIFVYLRTTK